MTASVAIPTYGREAVLISTIETLLATVPEGTEVLIIDQTRDHLPETAARLEDWNARRDIRLVKRTIPSIPQAMNEALALASRDIVIFLDDDIVPEAGLVEAHLEAHQQTGATLVAGRVVQPWEEGVDLSSHPDPGFAGGPARPMDFFMGGNFSVRKEIALAMGGFDENFVGAAYNFEREFAYRLRRAGRRIQFEPGACIHHLKVASGGTRRYGHHLTTAQPAHSVGAYYSILRTQRGWGRVASLLWRPVRAVSTRHHLRRPWWIPMTLVAELRGALWALILSIRGPKYVNLTASDAAR